MTLLSATTLRPHSTLSPSETEYPTALLATVKPPPKLYIAGSLEVFTKPAIAIVGSRAMSRYGQQVCELLVPALLQRGFVIVSGLATGIDAMAHELTLEHGGHTIGVIATGIDDASMYPAAHVSLAKTIVAQGGAIVSEYPVGTKAKRFHFSARNRIIAGLAVGSIIVEAREKSGALITARYSLEANREVWAVPGSIFTNRSVGTHGLLQQGAKLVNSVEDVLDEISDEVLQQLWPNHLMSYQQAKNQLSLSRNWQPRNALEAAILQVLNEDSLQLQDIIKRTSSTPAAASLCLTELEILGIVRKHPDFSYQLNR